MPESAFIYSSSHHTLHNHQNILRTFLISQHLPIHFRARISLPTSNRYIKAKQENTEHIIEIIMCSDNFSTTRSPLASLSPSSVNRQQNSKKRSLNSSPSSYGKEPGRHQRRTTLKRSFGVLNLSLGQGPKVEHAIKKKQPSKDRKDPTTMVQSFSELQFEEATRHASLMPTSSYEMNQQEDSPSKCALAHRLDNRRGPLDKAPLTNPVEAIPAPTALSSVKPLQMAFTNSGLRSKKCLNRRPRTRMPDTP